MSGPGTGAKRPAGRFDGPEAFAGYFGVSRETVGRLTRYGELLTQWQNAVRLVAPSTLDDLWHRHFADSAQLLGLCPEGRIWLDLGSGAGFPGMVIAILSQERAPESGGAHVHLVESNRRKCAFLREVARATQTDVEIHSCRIETLHRTGRLAEVDVVTARALSPLPQLIDLAAPWLAGGAIGLFAKGRDAQDEIESAGLLRAADVRLHESLTDAKARIVEIRDFVV